jgi:CheY-like chemotaxis protein
VALIDIGLDDADGFEVARTLRRLPGGETVHLIALTGYSDTASRERAREAGFDEFVVKPLAPEKFKELLSQSREPREAGQRIVLPNGGTRS